MLIFVVEILPPRSVVVNKIKARSVLVKWLAPAHLNNARVFYQLLVYQYSGDVETNSSQWFDGILVRTINTSDSLRHQTVDNLRPFTRYVLTVQAFGVGVPEMDRIGKISKPSNVSFRTRDEGKPCN